ncbi:MAG: hypothetical protein R3F60_30000 [bacterium]
MSLLLVAALLAPPTCRPPDLVKVAAALEAAPARHRHLLALVGVAEACALPAAVARAAHDRAGAPPGQAAALEARAISQAVELWNAACPGGIKLFAKLAAAAPDQRPPLFHAGCQLDRLGIPLPAPGTEISPLGVMLAAVVHPVDPALGPLVQALVFPGPKEATP